MKKKIQQTLFAVLILTFFNCSNDDAPVQQQEEVQEVPETVIDADGNEYNTIRMGDQIWMLENLKTTTYNDGTPIIEYDGDSWSSFNDQIAYYQWASTTDLNNVLDEEVPIDYYGAMYNHWAIASGKLAPEGWRIPTQADFEALENYIASQGYTGNEANALKTETGWTEGSGVGTNNFGFNGLPNGYVNAVGGPIPPGIICTWATADVIEQGASIGSHRRILVQLFNQPTILYSENALQIGAGIRCIKIQ